ncbi:MAG: ABC transporter permease subunit [Planctomycetota bacterium]|jgi:NitT/TauT family transport system permease protein|nr:ABC transporter permease subunit [Planctomycetota bacterium]
MTGPRPSPPVPRWLGSICPPVAVLCLVLIGWHLAVEVLDIRRFLLPPPGAVLTEAWERADELSAATGLTALAALLGFSISLVLGSLVALVFSQSPLIRRSFYPMAIFLQTVPIIAIAPLIIIWVGEGFVSVVIVTVIISLFPIITNTTTGLTTLDANLVDLFRLHRASRWDTLRKLRIPNAIPNLITGARISSGLAVVGAIIGEIFAGHGQHQHGLGYHVYYAGQNLETEWQFAVILASTLLGVLIFAGISLISRVVLHRWTFNLESN